MECNTAVPYARWRRIIDPTTKESAVNEARFWTLVDAVRNGAGDNQDARAPALRAALAALPAADIVAFQRIYDGLLLRAHRWDLWGAAWLMMGGCSAAGFRYFRDWLVSEGRHAYERALADPDDLADYPARAEFELEPFGHAATEAYAEHSDEVLVTARADAEPEGKAWAPDDLPALLPRLAEKYRH
jgi:hypothetical protein